MTDRTGADCMLLYHQEGDEQLLKAAQRIHLLETRISELEESLAEWVADGKAMEGHISELKERVVNLNRHITDLQDDKRLLKDRIDELEQLLRRATTGGTRR